MAQNEAQLVITAVDRTRAAFESVKHSLEGIHKAAESVGKVIGFGILGAEIKELGASILEAGLKFEQTQTELRSTLKSTEQAAGLTLAAIKEISKAASEKTNFSPTA